MATITNLTSGIEINYGGAVTYIKHGNVKLLKRGTYLNIYDDSDDDGNQRGQVYISIPFSEVTSPSEADIDALYATVRGYIDVSSGEGGNSKPSLGAGASEIMYEPVYTNDGKDRTITIKMAVNRNLRLPIMDQSDFSINSQIKYNT